jgi:hypothetical protein
MLMLIHALPNERLATRVQSFSNEDDGLRQSICVHARSLRTE